MGLHPNDIFPKTLKWESQNWDFYCFETLDIHIFFYFFWEHASKISHNSQKDLSNDVLHAPVEDDLTLVLRGFVFRNQVLNLTPNLFLDHNLCI